MSEPKPASMVVEAGALCVRLCREWRLPIPGHDYFRAAQLAGKMIANGADLEEIERVVRSAFEDTHGDAPPPLKLAPAAPRLPVPDADSPPLWSKEEYDRRYREAMEKGRRAGIVPAEVPLVGPEEE